MRRQVSLAAVAAGLVALAAAAAGPASIAQESAPELAEDGARLFRIYCASCHGKEARGDGPTAAVLTKRPTDLRRLSREGQFPYTDVYSAIDGRGLEHGTREMPIWGLAFQEWDKDTYQEAEVRARIERLVAFIRSIQEE